MRTRLLAVSVLLGACTVDRSILDDEVWPCESDPDCIDGYGCLELAPYGDAFCAPEADGGCDGVVTANGLCVDTCRVGEDGCRDAYSCVRGSVLTGDLPEEYEELVDRGYCLPVDTCSSSPDCTDDGRSFCLSESMNAESDMVAFNSAVCLPECDEDLSCPSGQACLREFGDGRDDVCLPRCGADGSCPPLFSCYDVLDFYIGAVCLPGFGFFPCRDDLDCLLGECLEASGSGRRFCSFEGCDNPDLGFLCGAETSYGEAYPWVGIVCDEAADICVGVLGFSSPCTTDRMDCAPELLCHDFEVEEWPPLCTARCARDEECPLNGYCALFLGGWCVPKREGGQDCVLDRECLSGRCRLLRCTDRGEVGAPCASHEQCITWFCGRDGRCGVPE